MKNEYNQTPKSIAFSVITIANKLKKNQTNNIIIKNSFSPSPIVGKKSNSLNHLSSLLFEKSVENSNPVSPLIIENITGSKFNGKTDAINYYNNKISLENSKFLKEDKNKTKAPLLATKLNNLNLLPQLSDKILSLPPLAFARFPFGRAKVNYLYLQKNNGIKNQIKIQNNSIKLKNLDLVNLNTKVDLDLTNFSFNKNLILSNSLSKWGEIFSYFLNNILTIKSKFSYKSLYRAAFDKLKEKQKKTFNLFSSRIYKKNKKKIMLYKYLTYFTKSNNIINTNPNLSKKYGLLLKYNRSIGYNFSNKILKTKAPLFKKKKIFFLTSGGNNYINFISEYKEETYKLLFYFFKSIYCLISKPTILFSPDFITIRLFYYLMIPKKKVFKFFSLKYNKTFKEKWIERKTLLIKKKKGLLENRLFGFKGKKRLSDFKKVENIFNLNIIGNNKKNKFNFNKNVNLNPFKIRLPYMKFKVRKAVSRLNTKPALIKKVYFDLMKFNLVKVFKKKFLVITNILSKLFNKPVILEITRIHNFKYDTNILANALQLILKNKNKRKNIKNAINKVYKKKNIKILNNPNLISKNNIISFLSGLNIYINGRIMREPIIPKITTKKYEKGATSIGKVNFIDTSFITKKNRKGAFTIKVKAAQNFF